MTLSSPIHLSEGRDETRKYCHLFCFLGKNSVSDFKKKLCLTFDGDVDLDGGDVYDDDVQLFSHL